MATKKYNKLKLNKTHKRCMDVEGGYKGDNGRIILYPCHTGPNQKFHHNRKTKQLMIKSSGKCVDLLGDRLVQNTCSSSKKTQKWIKRKNNWISVTNNKCIRLSRSRSKISLEKDPKTFGDLVTKKCSK